MTNATDIANTHTTDLSTRHNACAEHAIRKAAELVELSAFRSELNGNVLFNYPKDHSPPDVQVDFTEALGVIHSEHAYRATLIDGHSRPTLHQMLQTLRQNTIDQGKGLHYFLRTGINGGSNSMGSGHFQVLSWDKEREVWQVSCNLSTDSPYDITTVDGQLTEHANRLVHNDSADWGRGPNQYQYFICEITPESVMRAANFVWCFRVWGSRQSEDNNVLLTQYREVNTQGNTAESFLAMRFAQVYAHQGDDVIPDNLIGYEYPGLVEFDDIEGVARIQVLGTLQEEVPSLLQGPLHTTPSTVVQPPTKKTATEKKETCTPPPSPAQARHWDFFQPVAMITAASTVLGASLGVCISQCTALSNMAIGIKSLVLLGGLLASNPVGWAIGMGLWFAAVAAVIAMWTYHPSAPEIRLCP